jgi:hypothetical protein
LFDAEMRIDPLRTALLLLFVGCFLCGAVGTVPSQGYSFVRCLRLKGGEGDSQPASDASEFYHHSQWDEEKKIAYQVQSGASKRAAKITPPIPDEPISPNVDALKLQALKNVGASLRR